EALLTAFDRLFDRAVTKLNVSCTAEERAEVRRTFEDRYGEALRMVDTLEFPAITEPAMEHLESAIDSLSPPAIAGHLATGPLALHAQEVMRPVALRAAEQRLIEQLVERADDTYGGN